MRAGDRPPRCQSSARPDQSANRHAQGPSVRAAPRGQASDAHSGRARLRGPAPQRLVRRRRGYRGAPRAIESSRVGRYAEASPNPLGEQPDDDPGQHADPDLLQRGRGPERGGLEPSGHRRAGDEQQQRGTAAPSARPDSASRANRIRAWALRPPPRPRRARRRSGRGSRPARRTPTSRPCPAAHAASTVPRPMEASMPSPMSRSGRAASRRSGSSTSRAA